MAVAAQLQRLQEAEELRFGTAAGVGVDAAEVLPPPPTPTPSSTLPLPLLLPQRRE